MLGVIVVMLVGAGYLLGAVKRFSDTALSTTIDIGSSSSARYACCVIGSRSTVLLDVANIDDKYDPYGWKRRIKSVEENAGRHNEP